MELKARELAALVGGVLEGNPEAVVSGFAKIEEARSGDVTFLANPKYTHHIYTTGASLVLVRSDFSPERPLEATLIRVDDPYATLARLLKHVESAKPRKKGVEQPCFIADDAAVGEECYIGAFAYIGKGARIGDRVQIYPQSYVGDGVVIGDDTIVRPGVKIYEGCRIGSRCILHSGVVVGADGFGFAPTPDGFEKIPQTGIVVIEDDVELGANACVDRATFGRTLVGRGTKIDNMVQVAHNVEIGNDNVFSAQTGIAGSTRIGSRNMVGGQVGFAGHITIGDDNQIGAQSGIPNNVGSGNRLMGYPAVDAREFAKNLVYIKRLKDLLSKK